MLINNYREEFVFFICDIKKKLCVFVKIRVAIILNIVNPIMC